MSCIHFYVDYSGNFLLRLQTVTNNSSINEWNGWNVLYTYEWHRVRWEPTPEWCRESPNNKATTRCLLPCGAAFLLRRNNRNILGIYKYIFSVQHSLLCYSLAMVVVVLDLTQTDLYTEQGLYMLSIRQTSCFTKIWINVNLSFENFCNCDKCSSRSAGDSNSSIS